jgi:hypothetical protein
MPATSHAKHDAPLITTYMVDVEGDFLNLKADAMSREEHKQQLTQFDLRQQPGRIGACNATCSIAPRRRTHVG